MAFTCFCHLTLDVVVVRGEWQTNDVISIRVWLLQHGEWVNIQSHPLLLDFLLEWNTEYRNTRDWRLQRHTKHSKHRLWCRSLLKVSHVVQRFLMTTILLVLVVSKVQQEEKWYFRYAIFTSCSHCKLRVVGIGCMWMYHLLSCFLAPVNPLLLKCKLVIS